MRKVLVVEDQPEVRKLIAGGLRRYGYRVIEAAGGEEALLTFAQPDRPIDLVITDVVMPGMTGHEVGQRMAALNPGVKVLYISGYTENVISRQSVRDAVEYLPKPFTPADLAGRIRQLLGSRLSFEESGQSRG
jgi:CheY-like chemotaxis protein